MPRLSDRRCADRWRGAVHRRGRRDGVPVIQRAAGDGLFTQSVRGGAVIFASLAVPRLLGFVVSLQSRRDQSNHPVGDYLVAGGADMNRVIEDLALGGIEHIA